MRERNDCCCDDKSTLRARVSTLAKRMTTGCGPAGVWLHKKTPVSPLGIGLSKKHRQKNTEPGFQSGPGDSVDAD